MGPTHYLIHVADLLSSSLGCDSLFGEMPRLLSPPGGMSQGKSPSPSAMSSAARGQGRCLQNPRAHCRRWPEHAPHETQLAARPHRRASGSLHRLLSC